MMGVAIDVQPLVVVHLPSACVPTSSSLGTLQSLPALPKLLPPPHFHCPTVGCRILHNALSATWVQVNAGIPVTAWEDLQELLGDAIPPVQALLRTLLELDGVNIVASPEGQLALVQELAATSTSNLRCLGRNELSILVYNQHIS